MTDHPADCVCDWCHAVAMMRRDLIESRRVPQFSH